MLPQVERDRVRRLWKVTIAGLFVLYTLAMTTMVVIAEPTKAEEPRTSTRSSQRRQPSKSSEQLAFDAGSLIGKTVGIWGGALIAVLLFRSARTGTRVEQRKIGGFAALFGFGAVFSIAGFVLVVLGMNPLDKDTASTVLLMKLGGAGCLATGAACWGYAFTRPLRTIYSTVPRPETAAGS
jgi:hypothetical protein